MRTLPQKDGITVVPKGEIKVDLTKDPKGNPIIKQDRKYELITPLFGGGVESGKNDDITPISGKGIRGHLRFWWRATRGGQFNGDLRAMKKHEEGIWGAASTPGKSSPSKVQIEIDEFSKQEFDNPYSAPKIVSESWKELSYAAFPFQDNPQTVAKYKFSLGISYPSSYKSEIEAALWAWETFGGIGARTRRGFGAIKLIELRENNEVIIDRPPTAKQVRKWIEAKLSLHKAHGAWHADTPHLPDGPSSIWLKITQAHEAGNLTPSSRQVWVYLVSRYRKFRQARFDKKAFLEGKGKQQKELGISYWPEANEIRRRLNIPAKIVDPNTPAKFPRAQFGLPINFHLPHDKNEQSIVLRNQLSQRRSSPLILRPIICLDEKPVGLALLLEPTSLPNAPLTLDGITLPNNLPIDTSLTTDEAKDIKPLNGNTDVLQAFLNSID